MYSYLYNNLSEKQAKFIQSLVDIDAISEDTLYFFSEDSFYGYFELQKNNIKNSRYYDALVDNTNAWFNCEFGNRISEMDCYEIKLWYLDSKCNDERTLLEMFRLLSFYIGEVNTTKILWIDINETLQFYPITNDEVKFVQYGAAKYFAEKFLAWL